MEVNKLIKARPLDNMEFMQWFKRYFDAQAGQDVQYDAAARRAGSKTGDVKGRCAQPSTNFLPKSEAPAGGVQGCQLPSETTTRAQAMSLCTSSGQHGQARPERLSP